MIIEIAGKPAVLSPRSVNWESPAIVARTASGAPVIGRFWKCSLSIDLPISIRRISFYEWCRLRNGEQYTFTLPHPVTGEPTEFTAYLDEATGRMDTRGPEPVMVGFDISLSRIEVS